MHTSIDAKHSVYRVDDKSIRYVAEENIEHIYQDPSILLMKQAGKYFKKWDSERRCFISNMKDEYPDD